ncbi:MAG: type I restriction enzyme endonuclease domain-containing protein [Clostridium sp.]
MDDFINDLSDELLRIVEGLEENKASFEQIGITYEKSFYDILVKVRDDHKFVFEDKKCLVLAKEIKKLFDDKVQYVNFFNMTYIKNQFNMHLMILLYKMGYPP